MEYRIEKEESFQVIGFYREIPAKQGYALCPKFWDEVLEKYFPKIGDGSAIGRAMQENGIGEFGVCIDHVRDETFGYMIAGRYQGGNIPEGMTVREIPKATWVKFSCVGPMPHALQSLNTWIWKEWLPNLKGYRLDGDTLLEWYDEGDSSAEDYRSGIWLPIIAIEE
jgi:AraC family transcriptional regulator